MGNMASLVNN